MSNQSFSRCRHCRGFYEAELPQCKWCSYQTRFADSVGKPRVYHDRDTVRAIQMAEYDQLPVKVRSDPMGPPQANLTIRCACIHCGIEGHEFEAIEMRWIANERMWACPCTTCGGRGFQFDIHPVEPIWECAECKRWYKPEKFTAKYARCPYCGSPHANGWFEDENEDGEPIPEDGEADLPGLDEDEMAQFEQDAQAMLPYFGKDSPTELPSDLSQEEDLPWDDDFQPPASFRPPGQEAPLGQERMPDDIDFPRPGIPERDSDDETDLFL